MDIQRLNSDLQYVSHLGQNIPLDDLVKLKLAMLTFREEHKPSAVHLWGRVKGFYTDYYVMVATHYDRAATFPQRRFYWSNESFVFAPLPHVGKHDAAFLATLNDYFTGEQDRILRDGAPAHGDIDDDEGSLRLPDIIRKGNQKAALTELDRLSVVVQAVDRDCAVVPFAAQKTSLTGQLLPNVGYNGQAPEDIGNLDSYRHLRDATEEAKLKVFGNVA